MADDTPFQTLGPFFDFALAFADGHTLVADATRGSRISIEGRVLDGDGDPIPDALLEIWQANAAGRYHHSDDARDLPVDPHFDGFGRVATDAHGRFLFQTIRPGPVPGPGGRPQAPHILVSVLGRGILTRLVTRIYFEDDSATREDPILGLVPAARRHTLLARRERDGHYRFDVVVQGEHETVFFDA